MHGHPSSDEFAQRLTETLSRFGVAGRVDVSGGVATLSGNGPTVSIPVGPLLDQWPTLPDEVQQRRLAEVARQLASTRRSQTSVSESSDGGLLAWLKPAGIALTLVLLAGMGSVAYRTWEARREAERAKKAIVPNYDDYERERRERAARVCDATRARVLRGAVVGPSDVEGWLVELVALRTGASPPLVGDPAMNAFIGPAPGPGQPRQRVVWATAPTLVAAEGPDTTATVVESNVPETGPVAWYGARVLFTGRYVVPYFDETLRQEYLRLAPALADALKADYAALYARCADRAAHYLGSWFRGPNPGGAVASLLYFMGTYGEHPSIRASLLAPENVTVLDRGVAFRNLSSIAAPLKKARVMTLIGTERGAISGRDGDVATVTFPFRDSNRASRAMRNVARELGILDER